MKKSKLGIFSMFAAMAMMGTETPHREHEYIKPKETDEQRKRRLAKAEIQRYQAKGLTQFIYGEKHDTNRTHAMGQETRTGVRRSR